MNFLLLCSILIIFIDFPSVFSHPFDGSQEEEVDAFHLIQNDISGGKQEFDRLTSYSKMPQYGQCWTDALTNLQSGCNKLTEERQMRLAMEFANCFLEKSGLKTFSCEEDVPVGECVKKAQMEPNFFTSYLQFFTHTQSICFYLSSELFQKRAENQVNNLLRASDFVTDNLKKSEKFQVKVLGLQQAALETTLKTSDMQAVMHESQQQSLAVAERALMSQREAVELNEKSQLALQRSFYEMQSSVGETRVWVGDIADRISRLQSVFIDEFTGFYSWMFYFVSTLAIFLLTSTSRTAGARIWLFILIGSTFFIERFLNQTRIASFENDPDGMPDAAMIKEYIQRDCRLIRQSFWAISVGVLVYFAFTFKDFNLENARRMKEIMMELQYLRALLPQSVLKRAETPSLEETTIGMDGVDAPPSTRSMYRRKSLSRAPLSPHPIATSSRNGSAMSSNSSTSIPRRSITPSRNFASVNESSRNLTPVPEDSEENGKSVKSTPSRKGTSPYNLRSGSSSREPENNNLVNRLIRQFSVDREKTPEQSTREMVERLAEITNRTRDAIFARDNVDASPSSESDCEFIFFVNCGLLFDLSF